MIWATCVIVAVIMTHFAVDFLSRSYAKTAEASVRALHQYGTFKGRPWRTNQVRYMNAYRMSTFFAKGFFLKPFFFFPASSTDA